VLQTVLVLLPTNRQSGYVCCATKSTRLTEDGHQRSSCSDADLLVQSLITSQVVVDGLSQGLDQVALSV
jgi:hypothetical protein